jgi:AAA+ superfamily predicted ATPase
LIWLHSNIFNLTQVENKKGKNITVGHYIFKGNPGTGKTTMGRIIGKKFKEMKFLKYGHFVEVTRDDLVGQYQGHTSAKTTAILESALDGVLFIDEAYSLLLDEKDMFGQEAINTIVPFMENHRNEFILIIAGYSKPLQKFFKSNTGLKSRFYYEIKFDDYTPLELYKIFRLFAKDYFWDKYTDQIIKNSLKDMYMNKEHDFGNARDVRKFFEKVKQNQSNRLVPHIHNFRKKDRILFNIEKNDLLNINV